MFPKYKPPSPPPPSQHVGPNKQKEKPSVSSDAARRPMQKSPKDKQPPATSRPHFTVPARKRTFAVTTSAACEAITHGEPTRKKWNVQPIDLPKITRRANCIIRLRVERNAVITPTATLAH
ncbi:hypothetical protein GE061_017887 [Apolygus lucorum]|uniref:Uncharacterized protein n=1 Tax=Apolygus lucorum TaxID=248454 RepID=A0A8S9XEC4_APOLU|nr:hypothetical protein GE061_017887 [Apolygus lucorum]